MKKLFLFMALYCSSLSLLGQSMSGNYTIDPSAAASSTNFTTIQSALSVLTTNGVSGAVNFIFSNGTYNEQLLVPGFTGGSSNKPVTFKSASNNPADVIISLATDATKSFVVGTASKHIKFSGLTLTSTGTTYAVVANIAVDSIEFSNCIFNGKSQANSSSQTLVNATSASVKFNNCEFNYGYSALVADGKNIKGAEFIGNKFRYQNHSSPVIIKKCEAVLVSKNDFKSSLSTSILIGIELLNCNGKSVIEKNKVDIVNGTGIRLSDCRATADGRGIVKNNMLYSSGSTADRVLYTTGSRYYDIYHNTAVNSSSPGAAASFMDAVDFDIKNNIFVNQSTGRAYSTSISSGYIYSDFNVYYSGNIYRLGTWHYTDFVDLAALKTLNSQDASSIFKNVTFSDNFLHLDSEDNALLGTSLAAVTDDFDGDVRSATPYRGADEYTGAVTSVDNHLTDRSFHLLENYPNPFNPSTVIRFGVPKMESVNISLFDMSGREIALIVKSKTFAKGFHEIRFDSKGISSGIYFCRIETPSFVKSIKMIVLK